MGFFGAGFAAAVAVAFAGAGFAAAVAAGFFAAGFAATAADFAAGVAAATGAAGFAVVAVFAAACSAFCCSARARFSRAACAVAEVEEMRVAASSVARGAATGVGIGLPVSAATLAASRPTWVSMNTSRCSLRIATSPASPYGTSWCLRRIVFAAGVSRNARKRNTASCFGDASRSAM